MSTAANQMSFALLYKPYYIETLRTNLFWCKTLYAVTQKLQLQNFYMKPTVVENYISFSQNFCLVIVRIKKTKQKKKKLTAVIIIIITEKSSRDLLYIKSANQIKM